MMSECYPNNVKNLTRISRLEGVEKDSVEKVSVSGKPLASQRKS